MRSSRTLRVRDEDRNNVEYYDGEDDSCNDHDYEASN